MSERVHSAFRLRSAGFGVIIGGVVLGVLSFVLSALAATAFLAVLATALAIGGRENGTRWMQFCLGIGAVGAIGLIEATTTFGIGLDPLELGVIAIVFGIFDVIAGTAIHRFRPDDESRQ